MHLRSGGIFNDHFLSCKFPVELASEKNLNIGQYLTECGYFCVTGSVLYSSRLFFSLDIHFFRHLHSYQMLRATSQVELAVPECPAYVLVPAQCVIVVTHYSFLETGKATSRPTNVVV